MNLLLEPDFVTEQFDGSALRDGDSDPAGRGDRRIPAVVA